MSLPHESDSPISTSLSPAAGPPAAPPRRAQAVALLSGGLDSILAVRLIAEQGIHVNALTFMTHFGCSAGIEGSSCGHDPRKVAEGMTNPNITVRLCHLGQEYIDMVRNPKHGWGKNMNPCVDCRIMMLNYAKEYLREIGGDFLMTGEVLGQRPMSQRLDAFRMVDRAVGMVGRILRPLSAKLLQPTLAEQEGIVDREKLCDIHGRSRRPQLELAKRFALKEIPQPAGGCLLTDPRFSEKLRDLFDHETGAIVGDDIHLLKIGRHIRLGAAWKLVVGRDQGENERLEGFARPGDVWMEAIDHVGPCALGRGTPDEEGLITAARVVLRYGKAPKDQPARVLVRRVGAEEHSVLTVTAIEQETLEAMRV
ncbi:MAG: hypothetical protein HZA54_07820 [Planctomycetes bacterium]|nr:hypothetical protein [Planctomycetota bacterium]